MKHKLANLLLAFCTVLLLISPTALAAQTEAEEIVILYTNDIHTYIDGSIRYSTIAALKDTYDNVLLLDAGDHVQGTAYGSMDKGETIVQLMNAVGYDAATLGNHEFDYGMSGCMQVTYWADYPYLSCNFYNENDGVVDSTVLEPYEVFEVGGKKIAVVGITTPETISSTTPAYFQDEAGNYIYGIAGGEDGAALYSAVQSTIDDASKEADIVIALGHLGDDATSAPWRSEDVIANTTGLDAFIDGHSHSTVPMKEVTDKGGNTVILTQTGEYLGAVGKMTVSEDGITTELLTAEDLAAVTPDTQVKAIEDAWITELEAQLGQVIGSTDVTFDNYDMSGNRLVRRQETNSGDFAADALYYLFDDMGMDVDVALMNGGGVRNKAITGEITYQTCKAIHTFGNVACLRTATGQQILDALEWGARSAGVSEEGSFLQVSGLTYTVDTTVPNTTQADEKGVWVGGPTGTYRVRDVQIYNKDTGAWEPLDLSASYNVAGYNYTLRELGDGFAMFAGSTNVLDYVMEDYMVLANYVTGFENGVVKADNSPLSAKYPGFGVDYGTVNGTGRIRVTYPVWIGGQQITETTKSGEGWHYDTTTNTLYLNNYSYAGSGYKNSAIYAESALNIVLEGENTVISSGYYGILVKNAELSILGNGSLKVQGSDFGIYTTQWNVGGLTIGGDVTVEARSGDVTSGNSYGIRADGALIIRDNAMVKATGGYAPDRSCGIYGYTTLDIMDNATVFAVGADSSNGSYGIRTTDMTVSGGALTATGSTGKYASCGIFTQTLSVTGGTVKAFAGTASNGPSVGVQAAKRVSISGGTLYACGGDAAASGDTSCGVQTGGPLTVSGGTLEAVTGSGKFTRAIQADTLTVTDGIVTATTSNATVDPDGGMTFSSGIQVSNGLTIENGMINAQAGEADQSIGIQSAANALISGGDLTAVGNSYSLWVMGTLTVECDEITFRTADQGTPGLVATEVKATGRVYAMGGIQISEKLTVGKPEGGAVKQVPGEYDLYYTIVDGETVAVDVVIELLAYQVNIPAASHTIGVQVPAGQSINEIYCPALGLEDFSQMVKVDKEGMIFEGWYTDEQFTQAFDYDTPVTEDLRLYGKWTPMTYTVTYVADGKIVGTVTVNHGEDATAPELPAKEGYTAAWDLDGKNITADTTITAVYTNEIPQTGDSNMVIGLALLMLCSGCLATLTRMRKKRIL
ncbi:MAG: 5'-nucleotidase C-terminal domain-containing protein [Clostridia bacterium]|nr:5'-nucleotidase C-terminal domain-containing protein [Clostridia bacterium]